MSAQWMCDFCGATKVGGTEARCERQSFTQHRVCFRCLDRVKVRDGLAVIAGGAELKVACPETLPDAERVVLSLARGGPAPNVFKFYGGPADGEVMAVQEGHTEVRVPVPEPLPATWLDDGDAYPRKTVKVARYVKVIEPDGPLFVCVNESELR